MSGPSAPRGPVQVFFGVLLIIVGLLMVVFCGGCALLFGAMFIADTGGGPGNVAQALLLPLILGGIPALAGAVLVWVGWRLVRPPKRPTSVAKTFE
jgi:hypothetical protein